LLSLEPVPEFKAKQFYDSMERLEELDPERYDTKDLTRQFIYNQYQLSSKDDDFYDKVQNLPERDREKLEESIGEGTQRTLKSQKVDSVIQDSVSKFKGGQDIRDLEDEIIKAAFDGDVPPRGQQTPSDKSKITKLKKEFRIRREFGYDDEYVNAIMDQSTNAKKLDLLRTMQIELGDSFEDRVFEMKKAGLISDTLMKSVRTQILR